MIPVGSPIAQRLGIAAAAFLLTSLAAYEGRRLVPYGDLVGIPTVCDGITGPDVVPGKTYTMAECDSLLAEHAGRHVAGILTCIHRPMDAYELVAWTHFAYNVGVAAFCRSTAARRINAGERACDEIRRWVFVGGKDCRQPESGCRGIVARREHEYALCEGRIRMPGLFDGVTAGVAT